MFLRKKNISASIQFLILRFIILCVLYGPENTIIGSVLTTVSSFHFLKTKNNLA